jgi:hypothetical protein
MRNDVFLTVTLGCLTTSWKLGSMIESEVHLPRWLCRLGAPERAVQHEVIRPSEPGDHGFVAAQEVSSSARGVRFETHAWPLQARREAKIKDYREG